MTAGKTSFYVKASTLGNIAATGEVTLVVSDCSEAPIVILQPKGYDWKMKQNSGIYSMAIDKFKNFFTQDLSKLEASCVIESYSIEDNAKSKIQVVAKKWVYLDNVGNI